jgi:hypothetical protein
MESHRRHLQMIFDRLREANLMLHPSKCDFAKKETKFLGHIISGEYIRAKTEKVVNFPRPRSVRELRSFFGLVNWFRRHISHFSDLMEPIQELLRKDRVNSFRWEQRQEDAFVKVKAILTNPPLLMLPDYSKTFYLCTDASERAISAILCQKAENGSLKPISYACRALRDSEIKSNPIHLKECLAILYGMSMFDGYLRDNEFVIRTDSRAITFMKKNEIMSSKLARWAVTIQSYNYVLEHVAAEQNGGPDTLSRLPDYPDEPEAAEELEQFLDNKILTVTECNKNGTVRTGQVLTITFQDEEKQETQDENAEVESEEDVNDEDRTPTGCQWVTSKEILEIPERKDLFQL